MTPEMENYNAAAAQGWCTVVVPCYNEEFRLKTGAFADFLSLPETTAGRVRFLFVNDGSRDNTLSILNNFAALHPERVSVLDKQPNGGKAEAVRVGMLHALAAGDTEYTGFWDADLATPLDAIPRLLMRLDVDPNLLMVFGARVRLLGRHIYRKTVRHYLGRIFATVVARFLLRLQIYDTQCGAKVFRATPELQLMLAERFTSRWIFDVELLSRFISRHRDDHTFVRRSIYEYPLEEWTDVAGSKIKLSDFFKAVAEVVHIYQTYRASRR